jgi:hypothetical protein
MPWVDRPGTRWSIRGFFEDEDEYDEAEAGYPAVPGFGGRGSLDE